jgi:hypothetical protein
MRDLGSLRGDSTRAPGSAGEPDLGGETKGAVAA